MLIYYPFYDPWILKNFLLRTRQLSLSPRVLVKPQVFSTFQLCPFHRIWFRCLEVGGGVGVGVGAPHTHRRQNHPLPSPHDGQTLSSTGGEGALGQQVTLAGWPPQRTADRSRMSTRGFHPAKHGEMCPALASAGVCWIFWSNSLYIAARNGKPKL